MIHIRRQSSGIPRLLIRPAFLVLCLLALPAFAASSLSGCLTDPAGGAVPDATIRLLRSADSSRQETLTDGQGQFFFAHLGPGEYQLTAAFPGFAAVTRTITLADSQAGTERIQFARISRQSESATVTAEVNEIDVLAPDPARRVFVLQDLLNADPGHPGTPVSIPGYPSETASGGIKAPQYFAPGVAGDHGEPIAQFIAVGGYLVSNNLSANAHGNGYADPNLLVPQALESIKIDGGAFNVREGNHSVNLAATYSLRSHLDPFLTLTGDERDGERRQRRQDVRPPPRQGLACVDRAHW